MAVVQRVAQARVTVEGSVINHIGRGLLILLGVRKGDLPKNCERLAAKILHLRIFPDESGKMNRSVTDERGKILIVSQFTLYGETAKGNRPSFSLAASADEAKSLYEHFVQSCRSTGLRVGTGIFQAQMEVELTNDGPITLICRSENE